MQATIVQPVQIQLLNANATAAVTATPKNVPFPQGIQAGGGLWPQPVANALFLNPGWWELNFVVNFLLAAATTTILSAGVNTVTGVLPTNDTGLVSLDLVDTTQTGTTTLSGSYLVNVPAQGISEFLVFSATFSAGAITVAGYINAYQVQP